MGLIMSKDIANFIVSTLFHEKECGKLLVSRSGRLLQRYDEQGLRQVVGCIPYRYTKTDQFSSVEEDLEVLLISSQKSQRMMFPKGGWERDESMEEAALRETLEEAGVGGEVESMLGKWHYLSKRECKRIVHEAYMFPMLVQEELEFWPEKDLRNRQWMSVAQAREACQSLWMKEALDKLVARQMNLTN
ncbi:nudix hydrolase 18, mitochondrial-like [Humulus lupulus]|uniref:nudix hydrolase 18, mitochondrial-like n=1 Tax=Humulus lupulus TaxID=3486 RepID=UPI002B40D513|nr:nudix hydrolase 18, mitochondrial-like [Humulus lupulus]